MSGGHFFDIFWTFFQRQPQHQDTFQTFFGHFSGRLPGSPKRHFGTLCGHFSQNFGQNFLGYFPSNFFPKCPGICSFNFSQKFPGIFSFQFSFFFPPVFFSLVFVPDIFPAQPQHRTLSRHFLDIFLGSCQEAPKGILGHFLDIFRQFLVLTPFTT